MTAFYNEIDPYAADWLRRLIKAGHLPAGVVDPRDIRDLSHNELKDYTQCHFFAGIGGWPLALRQAGWPDDRPVWTGSCPCQPFSSSGKNRGFDDERHLWPVWFRIIQQSKPATLFGEQVASQAALEWLELVSRDLERAGYAFGAADLCAAGIAAPHIRQRLWFGAVRRLAHTDCTQCPNQLQGSGCPQAQTKSGSPNRSSGSSAPRGLGDAPRERCRETRAIGTQSAERAADASAANPWGNIDWIRCLDGKNRPIEPSIFPLADGVPARVGRLRAHGNAIVPPLASLFIQAFDAACQEGETPFLTPKPHVHPCHSHHQ